MLAEPTALRPAHRALGGWLPRPSPAVSSVRYTLAFCHSTWVTRFSTPALLVTYKDVNHTLSHQGIFLSAPR